MVQTLVNPPITWDPDRELALGVSRVADQKSMFHVIDGHARRSFITVTGWQ